MRLLSALIASGFCAALLAACAPAAPASPTTAPAAAPTALPAPASPATAASPAPAASAAASAAPSTGAAPSPVIAASPAAAGGVAAVPSPTGPLTDFVAGYSEIYEGNIPLWYGVEKGIFARHGLNVSTVYTASDTAIAALLSGQVQASNGGGSEALSANANGSDIVVTATTVPTYPYLFMVPASITTLDQLRGQKVGVSSPGSSSDIATRVGLLQEGLDPDKDVQIIALGSSQNRTAAILQGGIQGELDQPPSASALEKQGMHVLFDETTFNEPTTNNALLFQRSYLNAHRDLAQAYIDGFVESLARLRKDPQGVAEVVSKYLGDNDPDDQQQTFDFTAKIFAPIPFPKPEQFQDAIVLLAQQNPAISTYDVAGMLDPSLVQSAADRHVDQVP